MLLVMYKAAAIKQLVISFKLTVNMVTQLSTHQQVYIHPSSCLFSCRPYPGLLLYTDLVYTSKCYMRYSIVAIVTIFYFCNYRNISIIEPEWLLQVAPNYFKRTQSQPQ